MTIKDMNNTKMIVLNPLLFDDDNDIAHCSCLLLSLCVLLIAAAMTYDCLNDSKLEYSNEDDSFDWECGYHYVRIGKDWDNDGNGHRHNHSLEAISSLIKYIEIQSGSYDLYYNSDTCDNLGDFMFYNLSQYFSTNINNNTSNINDTIIINDIITTDDTTDDTDNVDDRKIHPTNDTCVNANAGGILWLVFSSLTLVAVVITIGLVIQTICNCWGFRPIFCM